MVDLITNKQDHEERTKTWTDRVTGIEYINFNGPFSKGYGARHPQKIAGSTPLDKYERFMEYTREWMHGILTNDETKKNVIHPSEFGGINVAKQLGNDWWDLTRKLGSGKEVTEGLPKGTHTSKADKEMVYDKFMPAYRAIRESFMKRSFLQWIFNHAQYTAERDAMHAIRGIVMSLTGDSKEAFDTNFTEYRTHMTANIKAEVEDNGDLAAENENGPAAENNRDLVPENNKDLVFENGNDFMLENNNPIQPKNDIYYQQVNAYISNMDFYEDRVKDMDKIIDIIIEYGKLDPSEILSGEDRDTIHYRVITGLIDDSLKIARKFDELGARNANLSEYKKVMEEGAKQMFKYAFVKLSPMKFPVAEQLIAAQLITDIVISNATPAANNDPNFGKYAKCFAMKCSDEFLEQVLDEAASETQSELYMANKTRDIAIAREGLGIDLQVELEMDINEQENAPIQNKVEEHVEIKDKENIID